MNKFDRGNMWLAIKADAKRRKAEGQHIEADGFIREVAPGEVVFDTVSGRYYADAKLFSQITKERREENEQI